MTSEDKDDIQNENKLKGDDVTLSIVLTLVLIILLPVFISPYIENWKNKKKEVAFEELYASTVEEVVNDSLRLYDKLHSDVWTPTLSDIEENTIQPNTANKALTAYVSELYAIEESMMTIRSLDFPTSIQHDIYCMKNEIIAATKQMTSLAVQANNLSQNRDAPEKPLKLIRHGESKAAQHISDAKECKLDVELLLLSSE